ncbi:virulence factor TspB C-terminal domain-related protein [Aeromonas caviae]|uniref:virulence factor TspB C-terminal domain-related protein n=1 Tax=Aeromonas caviae TaxID=648 RepID=UPI002B45A501|nr:virulence factor TspB C-terminal domain-related protein [Aeromonas caviae]
MRPFLFLLFICPSAFAAYTEMVIEGVKQSNGVWTTAGVMDTQGFVRTTSAVTVAGTTRNLPVVATVDMSLSSTLLKGASRAAGPILLAATAYDVYQWFTSDDIDSKPNDNNWYTVTSADTAFNDIGDCYKITSSSYNSSTRKINSMSGVYVHKGEPYVTVESCVAAVNQGTTTVVVTNYSGYFTGYSSTFPTSRLIPMALSKSYLDFREESLSRIPPPSPAVLNQGFSRLPALKDGFPVSRFDFTPYSEWSSDPYFKDGNWWRDRMDVSPAPTTNQPTRVRVDYGPVKLEGQTDPTTTPDTGPADGNTQPKEQTKFCDDNPMSIACAEMGKLEEEELDTDERPFQITPKSPWGSDNSSCPAPQVIHLGSGAVVEITYQPTCDFLAGIRPAVLALAFLAALYIALGIPVGKGD